jgi:HK97 family phage prohead protease
MAKQQTEFKSVPQYIKSVDGRTVEGVFGVFGNLDSYNDISHPGSFAKTIAERGGKVLHLWQHDFWSPPTAVVTSLREIERLELPAVVQAKFPEATGGAAVKRTYIESPRADEILALIKAGSPLEMSYGYDAIRVEYEETEDHGTVRHLLEQRLWETSDVLWGANSATTVSKARPSIPLDTLLGQLDNYLSGMKEGRRNAEGDLERINTIATLAYELGATSVKLVTSEDEKGKEAALAQVAEAAMAAATKEGKAESETPEDGEPKADALIVVVDPEQAAAPEPPANADADGKIAVGGNVAEEPKAEAGDPEEADKPEAENAAPEPPAIDPESAPEPEDAPPAEPDSTDHAETEDTHEEVDDEAKQRRAGAAAKDEQPLTLLFAELDLLELEVFHL